MSIIPQKINTQEEYRDLVEKFSWLADQQLRFCEECVAIGSIHEVLGQIPSLISIVNAIGYLRGQDGAFLDFRPHTDYQKELYENEDNFEKRLRAIIEHLMNSELKQEYIDKLQTYYIKTRTLQSP